MHGGQSPRHHLWRNASGFHPRADKRGVVDSECVWRDILTVVENAQIYEMGRHKWKTQIRYMIYIWPNLWKKSLVVVDALNIIRTENNWGHKNAEEILWLWLDCGKKMKQEVMRFSCLHWRLNTCTCSGCRGKK